MLAISNSIVHLTMQFDSTVLAIGTGVLYEKDNQHFIVTAWHNVTGLHPDTMSQLSGQGARPNKILATLAMTTAYEGESNAITVRLSIELPLEDEDKALFYIHPTNWPRVDVVAIPFDPRKPQMMVGRLSTGENIRTPMVLSSRNAAGVTTSIWPVQKYLIPDANVAKQWLENVGETEELFIPGYPQNIHDYYAQPVWKRATIASSVQLGWNRESKFLIDCASKSGMSGSPVLYYNTNGKVQIKGSTYHFQQDAAILAGVYVGRLGVTKEADPQIGTVWHRSVIDEIIDGKCFERLPAEIELSRQELEAAAKEVIPPISLAGLENIKNPDMPSRFYTRRRLMEHINGRASPERALEAILAVAESYDGPFVSDNGD